MDIGTGAVFDHQVRPVELGAHVVGRGLGAAGQAGADGVGSVRAAFPSGEGASSANRGVGRGGGLAAARALCAFGRGDDREVIDRLAPVRHHLSIFGGSHAQRDAYQRTLVTASIRSGERALASALLDERIDARPSSVWAWAGRARLARKVGDADGAAVADASHAKYVAEHRIVAGGNGLSR